MKVIGGGVTAALGFRASGISAGIKKSRKPDFALIVCDGPAAAAAVFTKNRVKAAPVLISRERIARGHAQAVVVNSGCANCMTGAIGWRDALTVGRAVSRVLSIPEAETLLASTGMIGRRLPVDRMVRAVPRLIGQLSRDHHEAAAQAILTTDLHTKEAALEVSGQTGTYRIGGMAKGAGMIAPSMATMLCVMTTDAAIEPALLRQLLRRATEQTFNRISVDGDMSTNDTVFALASGNTGVAIRSGSRAASVFSAALETVMRRLAFLIVQDGEGAAKVMEIEVAGARNERDALAAARQVAYSPLVKTMLAGSDPNPGRIAAAVGASSAQFNPERLSITIGEQLLVAKGTVLAVRAAALRRLLSRKEVHVRINLHAGNAVARMWTCDMTEEYIRINAGYAT